MSGRLADRECVPCRGGVPPLAAEGIEELRRQISSEWSVVEGRRLEREVRLKDFRQAMALANKIAEIAEEQGHHPDLLVTWGRLKIMLFTHAIGGLHDNDFIMAARIDALLRPAVP